MQTERLLMLDKLSAGYGRQAVLDGVDLIIHRGVFVGLVGGNGSGKTTLLKTILGILPPLAGRLIWGTIEGREPVLGYVPQRESFDPLFLFSALEVVVMGTYRRVPPGRGVRREEREWARSCLDKVNAGDLSRRRFAELSGGQKQRVLVARALATRPDFLLLDEPTAGIDATASEAVMAVLADLNRQGMTILMVNHDLRAVRERTDEVVWLHQGNVVQGGVRDLLAPERMRELLETSFGVAP